MKKKVALFAFNGDPMCFVHVLLNALDMNQRGDDVCVVVEGTATKLVDTMAQEEAPFHNLYIQVKELGLIACVCKACANKTGALRAAREQNLPLCDELKGHPSMGRFMHEGYEVISF